VHVAEHTASFALDDGIAGVLLAERDRQVLFPRAFGVENDDVIPERHHVPSNPVGVIEQAIHDPPGARFQLDALEDQPQFLWRMQHLDLGRPAKPEHAQE
jgi:hypothetical protein